jgi:rfaE bifunctional protein nucleotidyltransferase chain/domain
MKIIHTSPDELSILNTAYVFRENSEQKDYLNKRFDKPWGYEYLTYQTKHIGIWILHINKNEKTSLHCHFKKDTMLVALSGAFRIDTYNDFHILNETQTMYFPANTFHGIMSYSDNGVILEIEIYSDAITYSDKNDLLRLRDFYNRDKNTYEGSVVETDIPAEQSVNFHTKSIFEFGDSIINIKKYNKHRDHSNAMCGLLSYDAAQSPTLQSCYSLKILLDGKLVFNNILAPGSVIGNALPIQLINNECSIMEIQNLYSIENSKIIHSKEQLIDLIKKNEFKNIGLTSGCFDILHKGHINNLKLTKNYCNTLFVCLSSDKQIRELKGANRPINNVLDRMRMLSHMDFINYIILYDEVDNETEKELDDIMNILKPSYWFKGSDYNESQIREKHPILKKVCLFENIPNVSTTIINNKQNNINIIDDL